MKLFISIIIFSLVSPLSFAEGLNHRGLKYTEISMDHIDAPANAVPLNNRDPEQIKKRQQRKPASKQANTNLDQQQLGALLKGSDTNISEAQMQQLLKSLLDYQKHMQERNHLLEGMLTEE